MSRIGLFVCHCGINIAGTVDVRQVAEEIGRHPDVAFATDYGHMCSDPGQQLMRDAIRGRNLDAVVIAACSPSMHEATFRRAASSEGLNPYRLEIANIREQCSWVHQHVPARATEKATDIVQAVVEKVKRDEELEPFRLPLTKRALVIGGGIAGMQAALDIGDAGFPVVLVEREDRLGGKMAQLSGTYLNVDVAPSLLSQRIERVLNHPQIDVLTGSEVTAVDGYVGNFEVKVAQLIDQEEDRPVSSSTTEVREVGAVIVATGWDVYPLLRLPEYGGGSAAQGHSRDGLSGLGCCCEGDAAVLAR